MSDERIRTVGDLIAELETKNPDKPIVFQIPGAHAVGVAEVVSYEDAVVIETENAR